MNTVMFIAKASLKRVKMNKENVILFGAGKLGKQMLPLIRKKYNILYWTDNNKEMWGSEIDGITLTSPDCVNDFTEKIIVATGVEIFLEIVDQLLEEGISEEQIFWARNNDKELIIPYNANSIVPEEKKLEDYDILNAREVKGSFKVMILCTSYSTYVLQLIKNVKKYYPKIEISLLTKSLNYKDKLDNYISHLYVYDTYSGLKTVLSELHDYNTVHALFMENDWAYFVDLIDKCAKKIVLNVGGSDFYRSNETMLKYLHKLIDVADVVNVQSINVKEDFVKAFPETEKKVEITNYGLEIIDYIPQRSERKINVVMQYFSLPKDKIIVTCGHNGYKAHQHVEIIQAISKLESNIKKRICCVFPMTYPPENDDYIESLIIHLESMGVEYRVLTEYMDFKSMADYASISDIMIHVQTTDQLSSTMLEEMYAGSIVIAGSWLPYKWLKEKGIEFWTVKKIEDITDVLTDIINNYDEYREKCSVNRNVVYDIASWENLAQKWVALWE